jgi:hypothetical protein
MTRDEWPPDFLDFLDSVTGRRARTVIEHILTYGFITTEELAEQYGYKHPPRAARDVREQGVPLVTFRVTSKDGRTIGAYKFGDPADIRHDRFGGRKVISKDFKDDLLHAQDHICQICLGHFDARYLQVDHRVPYEIAGDIEPHEREIEKYMLLCGSCNRAKSWSCEQCPNWTDEKSPDVCATCYWAFPENYEHIAMQPFRRVALTWTGGETEAFDRLQEQATAHDTTIPEYIKAILANHLKRHNLQD